MPQHTDRFTGIAILVFGIAVLYATSQLPPAPFGYPVASGTFPEILGYLLILLSVWLIVRKSRPVDSDARIFSVRAVVGFGLTIAYVMVFRQIGFLVCTFALLVAYACVLQKGRLKIVDTLIVPAFATGVVYVLLRILKMPLPQAFLI